METFKFRFTCKILYNFYFALRNVNKITQKKSSLSQTQKIKVSLFLSKTMKDQQIVTNNNFIYAKPF
jgi:hypothetical protein